MRQTNVGVLGAGFSRTAVAVLAAAMVLAGCGDSGLTTAPVMPGGEGGMQAIGTDPNTGATIETNQDDYAPGEVVHLAGRGWAPGETVHLYMSEDPDTHGDVEQDVVADASGAFNLHFYDVQVHDLGVTFTLTATGGTSGSRAVAVFTDGRLVTAATIGGNAPPTTINAVAGSALSIHVEGETFSGGGNTSWTSTSVAFTPNPSGTAVTRCDDTDVYTPTNAPTTGLSVTFSVVAPTAPGTYVVSIRTHQGNGCAAGNQSAAFPDPGPNRFNLVVTSSNTAPILTVIGPKSVDEGSALTFTAAASDTDTPAQTLTFSLVGAPAGASITSGGQFSWTPTDGPAQTATFTVKVTDNGSPAATGEEEITVTVNNVAPVVSAGADATINEGGTFAGNGTFTDPGADTWTATVDYGDGGVVQPLTPSGKTFTLGHQYTTSGSYTVSVCVMDDDGASHCDTLVVKVDNVSPVVSAGADATINEGSTFGGNGTFTDPGADTWTATVDYGDGSGVQTLPLSGQSFSLSHLYADNGSFTVTVCVKDDDGNEGCDTLTVSVANVAPSTPTFNAPTSVNESDTAPFSFSATSTDPSTVDVAAGLQYAFSCDDGATFAAYSTSTSASCLAGDGPATVKLAVKARDKDGGESAIAKHSVTVLNVAPVVSLSGLTTVNEGTTTSYSYTFTDPGADTWQHTVSCGANGVLSANNFDGPSKSGSFNCTWADNHASQTVLATVDDGDGGSDSDTKTVTVNNVAPVVTLAGPSSANEGDTKSFSYTFTDPGADSWTRSVSCGANGVVSNETFGPGKSGSFQCTWPDDYASQTVSATVNDDDSGTGSDTQSVTIANVPPTITAVSASPLIAGNIYPISQPVTIKALFTDPGTADTHSCAAVATGVNVTTVTGSAGTGSSSSGQCSSVLTFASAGVYDVVMTVSDDDGGSDTDALQVVVYDPSAGFVTGGGWINAAAGSYPGDPSLSGKGTFGFVSKYLKGASVPTGNTQFVFHANGFNFSSSTYQFLVVNQNGTNAQFKGTGTVDNDAGSYSFMLWATDGTPDKFRIKIWDTNTNEVVFDNLLGAADGTVQSISSGSIVIHTGGKSK